MAIVSTTDVVQNTDSTEATNSSGLCCFPTGESFTIDTNTDSNFVNFDTSMTYAELNKVYGRFDDIAYYNAVDGGSPEAASSNIIHCYR